MSVKDLMDAINVSSNSYYNFMNKSGPNNGTGSDAFMGSVVFFKKREIAGLSMPRKKKAKSNEDDKSTPGKATATAKGSKKASKDDLDVSDIKLEGESNDSVPVYDTPQDIRGKINVALRNTSASQASLSRAFKEQFANTPSEGLFPASLKTFLSSNGHAHGTSSPIAYASYCYFEKLRIKQGKAKSKKRQEMEKVWGKAGMDMRKNMGRSLIMKVGSVMAVSQYGRWRLAWKERCLGRWARMGLRGSGSVMASLVD
jgi:hypothetical protein